MRNISYPTGKERQAVAVALSEFRGPVGGLLLPETKDVNIFTRSKDKRLLKKNRLDAGDKNRIKEIIKTEAGDDGVNLMSFTDEQRKDINVPLQKNGSIVETYLQSRLYQQTLVESINDGCINEYHLSELAGRVFEDLSFGLLAEANDHTGVVLSPERTVSVIQSLYPNAKRKRGHYGHDNIITARSGIYTPDGLGVNLIQHGTSAKVNVVFEYTMVPTWDKLYNQYRGFKRLKRNHPKLFAENSIFGLVVTDDLFKDAQNTLKQNAEYDTHVFKAPVTRDLIRSLVNQIRDKTKLALS
jgi:hypothetical protein